jgi:hypothetical protein
MRMRCMGVGCINPVLPLDKTAVLMAAGVR